MKQRSRSGGLPTQSRDAIRAILRKRPLENPELLTKSESWLLRARGHVFAMPKAGSPVIMLSSGGADSTAATHILMEKHKLVVYPLYVERGQRRVKNEEASVRYFNKFFQERYPSRYTDPFFMDVPIPPQEIRWPITRIADVIFNRDTLQRNGIPMYTSLLSSYAVQYANYLEITKGIRIRTVFCSFIAKDGIGMAYETLTALRTTTLNIISLTHDPTWQFTSLALETTLGNFWEKHDLLRWASAHKLPVERTWSCYWNGVFHCGICDGCRTRREAFRHARLPDATRYWTDLPVYGIYSKIRRLRQKLDPRLRPYV